MVRGRRQRRHLWHIYCGSEEASTQTGFFCQIGEGLGEEKGIGSKGDVKNVDYTEYNDGVYVGYHDYLRHFERIAILEYR